MIMVGSWTGGKQIWCNPIHYHAQLIDVLCDSTLQISGFGLPARSHQARAWKFRWQIFDVYRINPTVKSPQPQRDSNSRFCTASDRPTELRCHTEQCSDVSLNDQGLHTRIAQIHGIHNNEFLTIWLSELVEHTQYKCVDTNPAEVEHFTVSLVLQTWISQTQ